ncbi:RNA/RNP complex-1-interacting phosphatase isoform X2 [Hyla sarda]|uniref:RNA/RNP complex-1-interacting phosphatase isoform X2 n=1 Tax=Hyla sarda TaxID=327740 RepID=UPI0024C32EBA|nr:RNA/RNP complex-1-interacting phosphatase isoform X2 [Hyla sarda]
MAVCFLLLNFRVSFLRVPVSTYHHVCIRSAAMKSKNSLPDRWKEYIPIGKRIPGTRFICFKVPLKNVFDNKLAPWQRFSPSNLVQEVRKQNEELGMVVDLTCTKRYYSPQEFPNTITYCKIFTIGHEVPSDAVIAQFKNAVKEYLSENEGNDKLVGVHCTHGLNRTGYLVCRYLIDMLNMEPSEAIEKFNKSRGHSIERSNYLHDLLHGRSRSDGLDKPQASNHQYFPEDQPRSHSNARLDRPQARNQQHLPKKTSHSQPPPCPEAQPWSHSHTVGAPRCGPRFPGPPVAQPSSHHRPGQVMGPRHGFPHAGGRNPSRDPRIPRHGPPPPHMPGPRYSSPQVEGYMSHHFRGPNRHRHHPQRPFPHHWDYDALNGALPQDCRPRFCQQRDDHPGNYVPEPHDNKPYQRYPKPGGKMKPKNQRQ